MKKLIFTAALAFGSFTMMATTTTAICTEIVTNIVKQDFTEIAIEEVPTAITEALAKDYPTATIDKAYVNEEATYKLEITKEDGSAAALFADAEGNWLEM